MSGERFTHQIRVRYNECDAQGIVFNANWFTYFDVTITELWREAIGGYQHLPAQLGVESVVAETGARFRGAGRFDDLIDFAVSVARVGESSLRVEIDATRGDELLVEAFIEYVFVDPQSFRSTAIPDLVRNAIDEFSPPS